MADVPSVLFLGRHVGFPVALEGALKLKELAYIHAEGFAAGELKHGPIALIEEGQPVFVIVPVAARPRLAALQGHLQHPGDPGARRPHAGHRRGRRRRRRALRRRGLLRPAVPDAARAAAGDGAAADLRVRARDRARARRRPAAQPRQVRHGRVTRPGRAAHPPPPSPAPPAPVPRGGGVIIGVGIDVVDVARFMATLERAPGLRTSSSRPRSATCRRPRSRPGSRPRRPSPRRSARRAT